jgi:hypothetical protein
MAIDEFDEESDDFGFSFSSAEDVENPHKEALEKVLKLFRPLLKNLAKEPQKDTIVWPNRAKKVEEVMKKLDAITKDL